ncbi:hypothetical protein C1645_835777 [Glomus cerebriforme]|uniref:Uncharacterized protein n=1 Tax=Glomus cerebriforme TaxID=658196 RepID=A0A397S733_9GLOM|nr:hypothetical protein C1645_835777 [Glomus cerebriforme]
MSKVLKKSFEKIFAPKQIDIELSENSKKMIQKWKKQRSVDNEDPLLLIEWDEVGLVARSVANQAHTKIPLVNIITGLVGYAPFPSVTNPSDCAFGFIDTAGLPAKQAMSNAFRDSNSPDDSQIEEGGVWYDEGDYYEDDNTYNEGCYYEDKGYYYRNGRYERKVSPMASPIISPVTV